MFSTAKNIFVSQYFSYKYYCLISTPSLWGRDYPPVQTGPVAHPASCKMGTESFLGLEAAGK